MEKKRDYECLYNKGSDNWLSCIDNTNSSFEDYSDHIYYVVLMMKEESLTKYSDFMIES
jgi:hypothetical protein